MLAAVKAEALLNKNAAKEPHIVDANFNHGCRYKRSGYRYYTYTRSKILKGNIVHNIIPDQIEAELAVIAAAATRGCPC